MSTVDLSRLPAPAVVETLDVEGIVAARLAALAEALGPDYTAFLHSDPLAGDQIVSALHELMLRARVNEAARQTMLAFATGSNLDHIAANLAVERLTVTPATATAPAVMEDDARLRRRVQTAPETWSTAGSAGAYVYHALTAAPNLVDASAVMTAPGTVAVTLLGPAGAATPTAETIAAVQAALSADHVRPLTDVVYVQGPTVVETPVAMALTLYPGPDGETVRAEAEARVRGFLAENRQLGRDLRLSALYARAHVDGVQRVAITEPAADLVADPTMVVEAGDVTVTIAGRDE